jgi:RNA polymerase sigma-70 factor (ECF subfamily)
MQRLKERITAAVNSHESELLRYACSLGADLDTARDAVQDAFLQLWHCGEGNFPQQTRAWLYTVTRNRITDLFRRKRRWQAMHPADLSGTPPDSPLETLLGKDREDQLHSLIAQLSPREQELIKFKYASGLSYQEISRITGLSVSNVGVILFNALKKMRQDAHRSPAKGMPS